MYHQNQSNVGKHTSPMDGMGLEISSKDVGTSFPRSQHCEVATPKQSFQWSYYSFSVLHWLNFQVIYTYTLEINMEPKVMEVWKMTFPLQLGDF